MMKSLNYSWHPYGSVLCMGAAMARRQREVCSVYPILNSPKGPSHILLCYIKPGWLCYSSHLVLCISLYFSNFLNFSFDSCTGVFMYLTYITLSCSLPLLLMSSFSQLVPLLPLYLLLFSLQILQLARAAVWKSNCNGHMKNIPHLNHWGNETLKHSETSLSVLRRVVTKRQEIILINFMEKRTFEFTWQECKFPHSLWKVRKEIPQKS